MKRFFFVTLILFLCHELRGVANEPKPSSSFVLAPKCTFTAKSNSFSIKQYYDRNERLGWQIWVCPKQGAAYQLPEYDPLDSSYDDPAAWSLSPDEHWLARTQRTGSGTSILLLYHHTNDSRFTPAGGNRFGDVVYHFYAKHSGLTKEQQLIDHSRFEFYRWEDSRFLIISLSGESTLFQPMWVTDKWLVAYDLKRKSLFLTDSLIEKNIGRIYPIVHPAVESDALR